MLGKPRWSQDARVTKDVDLKQNPWHSHWHRIPKNAPLTPRIQNDRMLFRFEDERQPIRVMSITQRRTMGVPFMCVPQRSFRFQTEHLVTPTRFEGCVAQHCKYVSRGFDFPLQINIKSIGKQNCSQLRYRFAVCPLKT